jgi:hypothetical protein
MDLAIALIAQLQFSGGVGGSNKCLSFSGIAVACRMMMSLDRYHDRNVEHNLEIFLENWKFLYFF